MPASDTGKKKRKVTLRKKKGVITSDSESDVESNVPLVHLKNTMKNNMNQVDFLSVHIC